MNRNVWIPLWPCEGTLCSQPQQCPRLGACNSHCFHCICHKTEPTIMAQEGALNFTELEKNSRDMCIWLNALFLLVRLKNTETTKRRSCLSPKNNCAPAASMCPPPADLICRWTYFTLLSRAPQLLQNPLEILQKCAVTTRCWIPFVGSYDGEYAGLGMGMSVGEGVVSEAWMTYLCSCWCGWLGVQELRGAGSGGVQRLGRSWGGHCKCRWMGGGSRHQGWRRKDLW